MKEYLKIEINYREGLNKSNNLSEIGLIELNLLKEINKQLTTSSVSCQREQLLDFKKWELEVYHKPFDGDPNITVDTYLKAIAD